MGNISEEPGLGKNFATMVLFAAALVGGKRAVAAHYCTAKLANSDVSLCLQSNGAEPHIAAISAGKQFELNNEVGESLPATVEVNGASVAVQWKLQPHLGKADSRHVVFVYEAAAPHLRLHWVWESRASSGAMDTT